MTNFPREVIEVVHFAKTLIKVLSERSKAHAENAHPFHDKFGEEELMIGLRARSSECANLESVVKREAEKYILDLNDRLKNW